MAHIARIVVGMDTMGGILDDTARYLAEARRDLEAVRSGTPPVNGMSTEEAEAALLEHISTYKEVLRSKGRHVD